MNLIENVSVIEPDITEFISIARNNAEGVDVCPITLPTGGWVIIREQNGDDDGIISNVHLQKDASSINLFVAAVVAYSPAAADKNGILTLEEVLVMPIRDKYVIMIKSRIFSMGNMLQFSYTWDDSEGVPDYYEEDLTKFVWDYSTPFPFEPKAKGYDPERVAAYKVKPSKDGWIYADTKGKVTLLFSQLSTDPGVKRLRFKLLDGIAERKLLALGEAGMNINTKLLMRELEQFLQDSWHKVESFKAFKSHEMASLRKIVSDYDQEFDGNTEVTNPRTNNTSIIPLMQIPTFFFPQGI